MRRSKTQVRRTGRTAVVPSEFGPPETITSPNPYPTWRRQSAYYCGSSNCQLPTQQPTTARFIGTRHWTASARFGFFARPDHSIPPAALIRPIVRFSISTILRSSNFKISSWFQIQRFLFPNGITKLGLVGVDGISSAPSGGALTFGGLDSVLLATQNGSIILGGGISFQNIPNLFFYARGDAVALNLASPISGTSNLLLNSEGTVQVNGNVTVDNFNAFSKGDFQEGSGIVTAHDVTINSIGGNVTFDASKFADVARAGGTINLNANGTLTIIHTGRRPDHSCIDRGRGGTIDFTSSEPFTFDFSNSSVSFTRGSRRNSGPERRVCRAKSRRCVPMATSIFSTPRLPSVRGQPIFSGLIDANGSIFANGDIQTAVLTAGGDISDGGLIFAREISAGGNISAASELSLPGDR